MKLLIRIFQIALLMCFSWTFISAQATSLSPQQLRNIAVKAYIYAYPLVLMNVTQQVMTNSATPIPGKGWAPINQFVNLPAFPTPAFKNFMRPNANALYTTAWLDLTKEPLVLSVPNTHGRYYLMTVLDAWTNVIASVGKRTTGSEAENFILAGPSWTGKLPGGLTLIKLPTNNAWLIGLIQTNTLVDYPYVHPVQNAFHLTPLSTWPKNYTPPKGAVNSKVDFQTSPVEQVAQMDATTFFSIFAHALVKNSPSQYDVKFLKELKYFGLTPGEDYPYDKLSDEQKQSFNESVKIAQQHIIKQSQNLGHATSGWKIIPKYVGNYRNQYLIRAAIAYLALGSPLFKDLAYLTTSVDAQNKQLNGTNNYLLHFDKKQLPPTYAFWSLTLYDTEGSLVGNPIDRYALGSNDSLQHNADGSLDIYIQNRSPGAAQASSWLPAPTEDFSLVLRLYWPKPSVIHDEWKPPAVELR